VNQPTAKNTEELTIFVEREMHFLNLWTVYTDMLADKYIPTLGVRKHSLHDPRTTMMLVIYTYFYSLVEDSNDGVNAFRVWREHFPEEAQAIAALEAQVVPFRDNLRVFRNRLGFHGSTSRRTKLRASICSALIADLSCGMPARTSRPLEPCCCKSPWQRRNRMLPV
jgi:hypothetical protein